LKNKISCSIIIFIFLCLIHFFCKNEFMDCGFLYKNIIIMALSRKDIMLITNKEKAFKEIAMKTEWDNHRKAAERSSWKKKHEPNNIKKCPNRGKRYKKEEKKIIEQSITAPMIPEEEEDELCQHCQKSSEGYDFQCKHPICHPCFIKLFNENDGVLVCRVCQNEYKFEDNLVDEND